MREGVEDTGLMKPVEGVPYIIGVAVFIALVSATLLYSQRDARIYYRRALLSEKIEDSLGFRMSAKKEIMAAETEYGVRGYYLPEPAATSDDSSSTTVKTVKGGGMRYPEGGVTTVKSARVMSGVRSLSAGITESWDSRFEYLESLLEGQASLSCAGNETILVAVVGDDFMWEKKIRVLEDGIISADPGENATLWIRLSEPGAEELYNLLETNSSKSFMYPKLMAAWLLGDIKAYPVGKAGDIASCLTLT